MEPTTTVRYGMSNAISRAFDIEYTVGNLIADRSILGALSAPEGVVAVANGVTLDSGALVSDYSSITLEKQASSKA